MGAGSVGMRRLTPDKTLSSGMDSGAWSAADGPYGPAGPLRSGQRSPLG